MFPSWLRHHVPSNEGTNDRISIVFNLMFTGDEGRVGEWMDTDEQRAPFRSSGVKRQAPLCIKGHEHGWIVLSELRGDAARDSTSMDCADRKYSK